LGHSFVIRAWSFSRLGRPCFDFGLFLVYAFPVSILWYCFWSRGRHGFLLLLGLGSLFFFPLLIGEIIAAAAHG
jgi:hypothetical protein